MAKSVLAFVAAVAMVVGALAIRGRSDEGGGSGDGTQRSGPLELVCATELRAVCEAIDAGESGVNVTVEATAVTADRLKSVEPDKAAVDGWLAPGPWGEIVDVSRGPSAGELFDRPGAALARSPFVLAVWKDKRGRLACPGPVDLGCVGDAVIARGFRLGAAADDQAEGVLGDAALAAGHIDNPNFATNDLGETDLADWLASVDASVDAVGRNPGGRSFAELLLFGEAVADGFLSTEAVVGPQFATAAKRGQLDVEILPAATADVLFAPRRGDRGSRLGELVRTDRVRDALRSSGWRVEGDPRPLPKDDGLPSAGVLQALRDVTK